jgi:hypothetical protein
MTAFTSLCGLLQTIYIRTRLRYVQTTAGVAAAAADIK